MGILAQPIQTSEPRGNISSRDKSPMVIRCSPTEAASRGTLMAMVGLSMIMAGKSWQGWSGAGPSPVWPSDQVWQAQQDQSLLQTLESPRDFQVGLSQEPEPVQRVRPQQQKQEQQG